ncbi:MAG: ABC transporter permease [Phycisphaerae bacterium]|nr:ABC transporter permease [Gemmatimonadaceae bacterium]
MTHVQMASHVAHSDKFARAVRAMLRALALAGLAVLLLIVLLTVTGQRTGDALRALVNGAGGSWYAITSVTLVRAIPLALAGLAVSLAFRAGILNIGVEGQLLAGAAAATFAALAAPGLGVAAVPVVVVVGALAGAFWAGIAALLRRKFGVLEVISTIMLNYVALHTVGYLVRGPLQEPTRVYPQSFTIDTHAQLPVIIPGTRLHLGFIIAIALAGALWWWLRDRAAGFRLRAVGSNPLAALSAGRINVDRTTMGAFLVSGAIAGVAGASELTGVTYSLYENFSPGYGYTAIAVALLARLNPLSVLVTALLFGALEAGASAMQRDAGVPSVLVSVVEALLILLVLASEWWQSRNKRLGEAGT